MTGRSFFSLPMAADRDIRVRMKAAHLIESASFFRGLSVAVRKALESVCRPQRLDKGQVLFVEAREGDAFFLLVSGGIRLHKNTPDGREVVIRVIRPGEVFAEVVLFESPVYPVTATALDESLVLRIARRDFHRLLEEESFRTSFIAMLMEKQRYLAERLGRMTSQSVEERFFAFLREQHGEAREIRLAMSKKELAAAIGITPETLSRLLGRLQKEKRLRVRGRTLTLLKEQ